MFLAKDAVCLPYAYNAYLVTDLHPRTWKGTENEIRIIHYTIVRPVMPYQR